MVPKPTRITICDICGGELPERGKRDDPDMFGTIVGGYGHKATVETKVMRLHWPSSKWRDKASQEERRKPENRYRDYDFHGECILNLVEAAIGLRKQREQEMTP